MNSNRSMYTKGSFLQQYSDRLFDDELQVIISNWFVFGLGFQLEVYERQNYLRNIILYDGGVLGLYLGLSTLIEACSNWNKI